MYMEWKCADTIGTVPVPWVAISNAIKYKYMFQIKHTEAILSHITGKVLWFEISKIPILFKEINLLCYSL